MADVKSLAAEVAELEKQLDAKYRELAIAQGHKVARFKDTYGELPGALAIIIAETPAKLTIQRPMTRLANGKVEKPWNAQKASFTDDSLKAANIRYMR